MPEKAKTRGDEADQPADTKSGGALPTGPVTPAGETAATPPPKEIAKEIGGRDGPEPVRYGDWEKNGRCIDF